MACHYRILQRPINFRTYDPRAAAVPATDTTLVTTAMLQATHLGSKRHHTPKASSKVCELEKDRGATALAVQVVKSNAGIAARAALRQKS